MANTTSQSYSFDQDFSIDEIIQDAYERIGLQGTAGHQLKTARRSLNILFQEWGNRGIHFWEVGNTNINLVAGSTTNVDATAEGSGVYTFYRNSTDIPDLHAYAERTYTHTSWLQYERKSSNRRHIQPNLLMIEKISDL